jgi:LmbE family N-acetylglucosaminyl deacetylase
MSGASNIHISDLMTGPRPLHLEALALPCPLRIAVLAPHPDDFDAIGVSMRLLHKQGHTIEVAVLTSGASGVEDGFAGAHSAAEKAALREAEQTASCDFFGLPSVRLTFMRLWERGDDAADDERLRAWLHTKQPHLAFMPHGNDTNHTHRRVYETFRTIAQADGMALWACLNRDAKTGSMRTDLCTGFGEEEAQWKARLLCFHASQQSRNLGTRNEGFDTRVLRMNRDSARDCGIASPYAETFELQRFGA